MNCTHDTASHSVDEKHEWCTPVSHPELKVGDVHIWCISLQQSGTIYQKLSHFLSADEVARADRFRFDEGRRRFVVGRGVLRSILAGYLTIQPQEIRFQYGPQGKPSLWGVGAALHFNLSHSRDLALCACTRTGEIGIDVEHIHLLVDMDRIAHRIFSESDYRIWVRLPEQIRQMAFYRCWTQKEALIKACGSGLSQPMNQIAVPVLPGESSSLISWNGDCAQASDWSLYCFTPESETIAACALKARQLAAACFTWVDKSAMDV